MQVPQWVKPGFWGGVIGVIGIMIVGFGWLGWTLGSTAESLARIFHKKGQTSSKSLIE
jgi:hypothetical protein